MTNQSSRRSRVEQHAKRRKVNFILNILIGIVFLLIVVVGAAIIFDEDKTAEEASSSLKETELAKSQTEGLKNENSQPVKESEQVENESDTDEKDEEKELIVGNSEDPNVSEVIIDPNWKPIGTSQTGEHITNYDSGSKDRMEMEKAMEYATGISVDNMTVWWIGNGGLPNQNAIGTISTKDKSEIFRVYMDWIDGEGWKPTKIEKLKEIEVK